MSYKNTEILDNLEEPILITGHVNPDGDVISSAACLLNYFKEKNKKAYYIYNGIFPSHLTWVLDESEVITQDSEIDYKSLVVVDCRDVDVRLGFKRKKDIPTIVFDHHPPIEENDGEKRFILNAPSTSSIFYTLFDILDPIIYVGLFWDSLFHNNRVKETVDIASNLDITNEVIDEYNILMSEKKDLSLVEAIRNCFVMNYNINNEVGVTFVSTSCDDKLYLDLLLFFRQFTDIILLYNENSHKVHIREEGIDIVDVGKFAAKYGGGGHKRAAGIKLSDDIDFGQITDAFMEWVNENSN